ncbi:TPA: hypothetical protein ACKP22_001556 [Pseudomonas putida]
MKRLLLGTALGLLVGLSPMLHAKEMSEVRTQWYGACGHSSAAPKAQAVGVALVAILAPLAVSAAVDAAGAAIKASADTNSITRTSAPSYADLYQIDNVALSSIQQGCLVIAKGKFKANVNDGDDLEAQLEEQDMLLEVALRKVAGQPLYQLQPVYLRVRKLEDSTFWTKERSLVVTVTLQGVSSDKAFASATLAFNGIREGSVLKGSDARLFNARSAPFPAPQLPDAEVAKARFAPNARSIALAMHYLEHDGMTDDYANTTPDTSVFSNATARRALVNYCSTSKNASVDSLCSNWYLKTDQRQRLQTLLRSTEQSSELINNRLTWARNYCPNYLKGQGSTQCAGNGKTLSTGYFSTSATVTFTRDANAFGVAMGNVLSKSSGDVGKLAGQYLPDARKKSQGQEEEAARIADQNIAKALANERYAQSLLDEVQSNPKALPSELNKARLGLLVAMIQTNDAYAAAGLSPVHTSL